MQPFSIGNAILTSPSNTAPKFDPNEVKVMYANPLRAVAD